MDFHVSFTERRDLAGQIYGQLRAAILDGRLRANEPLPPSRELARRLGVARNTVCVAYDRLAGEGFITGQVGAGTFVDQGLRRAEPEPAGPPVGALQPRAWWTEMGELPELAGETPEFDFRAGLPDARLFPYETWRRLVARELRAPAAGTATGGVTYGDPAGHAGLRRAIARHIGVSRGVRADGGDVLVTSGMQQALDVVARVLLEPGDCAAVEEPGYRPANQLLASLGARVVGVPVDGEGLAVEALPDDARLVYVTPSHQFPLGIAMSLRRRMALLDWAARRGAAIVEDDYDSEFRFTGHPLEPLQSLDGSGRVVYIGSFSKCMLPTLRLGFLVAPASLHPALRQAKFLTDWHSPLANQAALARFIDDGLLARHIRKMRAEYVVRHQRVQAVLERDFGGWLEPIPSAAGLHLSARCRVASARDCREVVHRARDAGVYLNSFYPSSAGEGAPGFVIGYGAIATDRIEEGLARFRGVLADHRAGVAAGVG